jgi:hypothetical protein
LHWHIDEGQAADICEWPELVHWHRRRNRSADMIDVPHGKYIGGALATRPKAKPNPSSTARWSLIAAPVGSPWMWTLAFRHHGDRTPTHGYAETRETAMAAFAKSWQRE